MVKNVKNWKVNAIKWQKNNNFIQHEKWLWKFDL
jgi:hypothetical protein